MCARYSVNGTTGDFERLLNVAWPDDLAPAEEIRPTNRVLTVRGDGAPAFLTWGFVPSWSKDAAAGQKLINARSETAFEKPSFRSAFRHRRCILPASAFFEWRDEPLLSPPGQASLFEDAPKPTRGGATVKRKYRFTTPEPLFALAGLWSEWEAPDGTKLETCTILTTEANATMRPYHDRMPSILAPEAIEIWLDHRVGSVEKLTALLHGVPAEQLFVQPAEPTLDPPPNSA